MRHSLPVTIAVEEGRWRLHRSLFWTIRADRLPIKGGRAWRGLAICGWSLSSKARGRGRGVRGRKGARLIREHPVPQTDVSSHCLKRP
jgi:hypothetical protein